MDYMDAQTQQKTTKLKGRTEEERAYANEKLKKSKADSYDPNIKEPKKD